MSLGTAIFVILVIGGIFTAIYFGISSSTGTSTEKLIEKMEEEEKYAGIQTEKVTSDEKIISIIGYFGPLFLIPLLLKQDSNFAQFHARQGIVLFLLFIIIWILHLFLSFILPEMVSFVFKFIFAFIIVGFMGIGIYNVLTGEKTPLPILSKYISLN